MTEQKPASKLPGDDEVKKTQKPRPSLQASLQASDVLLRLLKGSESSEESSGEFTLERDEDVPLRFHGTLVGWNDVNEDVPRGTSVFVFVTRGRKIITYVHQWQRDKERPRERRAAGVHQDGRAALEWLRQDGGGHLGKASREAWQLACDAYPPLHDHNVEVVD